mmetsp:Transcript_2683/g.10471  ORF Transcript_2683/g.10471 Transcript_2683/m.10471 type:complete len:270 (-) Transcript_2683:1853-2662(-)
MTSRACSPRRIRFCTASSRFASASSRRTLRVCCRRPSWAGCRTRISSRSWRRTASARRWSTSPRRDASSRTSSPRSWCTCARSRSSWCTRWACSGWCPPPRSCRWRSSAPRRRRSRSSNLSATDRTTCPSGRSSGPTPGTWVRRRGRCSDFPATSTRPGRSLRRLRFPRLASPRTRRARRRRRTRPWTREPAPRCCTVARTRGTATQPPQPATRPPAPETREAAGDSSETSAKKRPTPTEVPRPREVRTARGPGPSPSSNPRRRWKGSA